MPKNSSILLRCEIRRAAAASAEAVQDRLRRPPGGPAVAVGVVTSGHLAVLRLIFQQLADGSHDSFPVRAHQQRGLRIERLRPLRPGAEHQHRRLQGGRLFLDAAGVGEDQAGALHVVDEGKVALRLQQEYPVDIAEDVERRLLDVRVEVHGEDDVGVGEGGDDVAQRLAYIAEGLAEVFAAVGLDQQHTAAGRQLARRGVGPRLFAGYQQRVHHGVSGDEDFFRGDVLAQQVVAGAGRGREGQLGEVVDEAAVHLLGEGVVGVAGSQAGLDVSHRDAGVVGGERGGERGGGVAVDEGHVEALGREGRLQPPDRLRGHRRERLPGLHYFEVFVGREVEDFQHLVEHGAVLAGDDEAVVELLSALELQHHGGHLDRLGPGAEYAADFNLFHLLEPLSEEKVGSRQ